MTALQNSYSTIFISILYMNNLKFKEIRQNIHDRMDGKWLSWNSNSGYLLNKYLFITRRVLETVMSKGMSVKKNNF